MIEVNANETWRRLMTTIDKLDEVEKAVKEAKIAVLSVVEEVANNLEEVE